MAFNPNRILKGNNGYVWLNGELLAEIKSIEAKITGNFEEANVCGDNATHHSYTGWTGEGTTVLQKVDSKVLKVVADSYKTGIFPELSVITKLTDVVTKKSERTAIKNMIITEAMLAKFEAKALVEEEIPFKFSDYEILETI